MRGEQSAVCRPIALAVACLVSALLGYGEAEAACKVSDVAIKSVRARFVNQCRGSPCYYLKGVAVLTNRCAEAVGVEVKIIGYDKASAAVAVRELWPASTRNIPPGDYTFSIDQWLDYDPEIKRFELTPVAVRRWR